MKKVEAIRLISKTFEASFEREGFGYFVKELLNSFDESKAHKWKLIKDSYTEHIASWERVGVYKEDGKRIDILIVHLKKDMALARARTMQRNFVAGYLRGDYGSSSEKHAALVAFVSADQANWRFSLVKLEYALEETDKGELKGVEKFTPARRWSFLVGENERSHTAQSQLEPILEDDQNNPTLEDLEKAFDIETVSDEFFGEYRRLFITVKEGLDDVLLADIPNGAQASLKLEFETKNVNSVDFAKKLLGQIIFLYYLQKKGWFGVPKKGKWGEGSKNFLREIFEKKHSDYENFFNDILEPLFYQALRTDRSDDSHYYDRFDCKIPFLNGGLFDPMGNYDWEETDIILPNDLFSNEKPTEAGDKGDGILDVFDRYNFTVREDEPFEKEVAIDPELLGKAYEKFNAIRPDNFDEYSAALKDGKKGSESKFNKKFGVYYTPREIVHYMCQQSLIQYLHTELNEKKSYSELGSEQAGMFGNEAKAGQLSITEEKGMTEISKEDIEMLILHGERIRENDARVVAEGRETSTYSFDMPPSIRAAAARVDEKLAAVKVCDPAVGSGAFPVGMMNEIVKAREVLSIYPQTSEVSTYAFKRECIENSLYGVDIDPGAVEIAKLRLWLSLVVDEEDIHNIKPLPNLDYKLMCGNSLLGLPDGVLLNPEKLQELEERKKTYFDKTNPNEKDELRKEIKRFFKELVESARQFAPNLGEVNFDFRTHFSEVFQEKDGFDIVIGNPPYSYRNATEDQHKSFYKKKYQVAEGNFELYKFFIEKSLDLARQNGFVTLITSATFLVQSSFKKLRKLLLSETNIIELAPLGPGVFADATVDTTILIYKNTSPYQYHSIYVQQPNTPMELYTSQKQTIQQSRFSSNTKMVFDYKLSDTGAKIVNKLFLDFPTLEDGFTFGVGINTGYIRDELVAETKIDERYHPMLPGSGISRYGTANTKGWIMFDRDYVKGRGKLGRSLPAEHFFSSKKILIVRTRNFSLSRRVIATIDENQFYNLNRLSNIIAKPGFNLFGLLGILNSQLYNWLFSTRYFDYEIKPIYLKECPLADTNSPDLLALVKKIIYFNQHEHLSTDSIQKEIKSVDHSIDTLVYELYGLTEEEIAIVEGREVDSSAQPIAKPAKKKVKAPVAPVKAVEEKKAAPAKKQVAASDYGLYKCSECGNKVMGFTKDEHVSQVHGEQAVDWVKMGGG